jgi:predicted MFS family arabinose efflux permease
MLGLNLTTRYSWTSPPLLALFGLGLVVGIAFLYRLATAPEPLIPIAILRNRSVICSTVAHSFGWSSIIGLNIFLPTYLQTVIGLTPTNAGLTLMALMITLNISAGLSGFALMRQRRYKILPMSGMLVAIAAIATLAWRVDSLDLVSFELLLALIGIGFGPLPGLTQTSLQNAVPRHQLGISVGTMNFSRSLLSTMLIAVLGAIVAAGTASIGPGEISHGTFGGTLAHDAALAAQAFRRVFFVAACTLTISFIAVVLLEESPLATEETR